MAGIDICCVTKQDRQQCGGLRRGRGRTTIVPAPVKQISTQNKSIVFPQYEIYIGAHQTPINTGLIRSELNNIVVQPSHDGDIETVQSNSTELGGPDVRKSRYGGRDRIYKLLFITTANDWTAIQLY